MIICSFVEYWIEICSIKIRKMYYSTILTWQRSFNLGRSKTQRLCQDPRLLSEVPVLNDKVKQCTEPNICRDIWFVTGNTSHLNLCEQNLNETLNEFLVFVFTVFWIIINFSQSTFRFHSVYSMKIVRLYILYRKNRGTQCTICFVSLWYAVKLFL